MDAILPVAKPPGMSSFDVIRLFKRETGFADKVGHGGTLDVFASGLMLILLGKATREFDRIQELEKEYLAGVRLGYSSDTLDIEGVLRLQENEVRLSREQIEEAFPHFLGSQDQEVPLYSAAKQGGKPLYKLARAGVATTPKVKTVEVHELKLVALKHPLATIQVACSSGTYIRQLTKDIFQKLGTASFLYFLERTRIGSYTLRRACPLDDFASGRWQKLAIELGDK